VAYNNVDWRIQNGNIVVKKFVSTCRTKPLFSRFLSPSKMHAQGKIPHSMTPSTPPPPLNPRTFNLLGETVLHFVCEVALAVMTTGRVESSSTAWRSTLTINIRSFQHDAGSVDPYILLYVTIDINVDINTSSYWKHRSLTLTLPAPKWWELEAYFWTTRKLDLIFYWAIHSTDNCIYFC
jgi:hypothetical protein